MIDCLIYNLLIFSFNISQGKTVNGDVCKPALQFSCFLPLFSALLAALKKVKQLCNITLLNMFSVLAPLFHQQKFPTIYSISITTWQYSQDKVSVISCTITPSATHKLDLLTTRATCGVFICIYIVCTG